MRPVRVGSRYGGTSRRWAPIRPNPWEAALIRISGRAVSRRAFVRGAVLSVPVLGAAIVAPVATAEPAECSDPSGMVGNCAAQLPQQFTSTSFSTTAIAGGTNYSILFSTRISRGPLVPSGATGYRIRSTSVSGTKLDGSPFLLTPGIGEVGPRILGARSASSLGFALDVPWDPNQAGAFIPLRLRSPIPDRADGNSDVPVHHHDDSGGQRYDARRCGFGDVLPAGTHRLQRLAQLRPRPIGGAVALAAERDRRG